jgi:molybdenum cofactor cytidylyltransferase
MVGIHGNTQPSIRAGVILLGAGASSRMGRPKLLLPWRQTSVLGLLLQAWSDAGASQIAVVLGGNGTPPDLELDRLKFGQEHRILNPNPERGMFSSIQCAARWSGWRPGLTHWILSLGDQPQILTATFRELLAFASHHPASICQPNRQGRPKHPVLLPQRVFADLAQGAEPDLKAFLAARASLRQTFDSMDEGLDFDIDNPEDYQRAQAFAEGKEP